MKKILITGVAGFIGYSLAEKFLNKGFEVYNDFKSINNFDLVSVDRHIADVLHTHGSNKKILKKTKKKKIIKSDIAIKNTFKWYNKNNIFKIS
tara:strand:- start:1136 stop:1414 length:279 start_codon:yes stop_codon:yes gene_type:complete